VISILNLTTNSKIIFVYLCDFVVQLCVTTYLL